jgi:hypothetical protein
MTRPRVFKDLAVLFGPMALHDETIGPTSISVRFRLFRELTSVT